MEAFQRPWMESDAMATVESWGLDGRNSLEAGVGSASTTDELRAAARTAPRSLELVMLKYSSALEYVQERLRGAGAR
jgi:hypothetical protein